MSQAKVDKYKEEKLARKNKNTKSKVKDRLTVAGIGAIGLLCVAYMVYSVLVWLGVYTPPKATEPFVSTVTAEQLAANLASGSATDPLGYYSKAAAENKTEEATTGAEEKTTSAEEETTVTEEETTVTE